METNLAKKAEVISKYSKGIFALDAYVKKTEEFVNSCFDRHDVPHAPHSKVKDLNDRTGLGILTAEGRPVSGYIAPEDYHIGGPSPAIPIIIGSWAFAFGFIQLLVTLGMLKTAIVLGSVYVVLMIGLIGLGNVLMFLFCTFTGFFLQLAAANIPIVGPIAGSVLSGPGASIIATVFKFTPFLVPLVYMTSTNRAYLVELTDVGTYYSSVKAVFSNAEARAIQMANCLKDPTRFNTYGHSRGGLTAKGDSFAAEEGLPVGMTAQDMRQHVFFFGNPGTGKTTLLKNSMAGVIKDEIYQSLYDQCKEKFGDEVDTSEFYEELMEEVDRQFNEFIEMRLKEQNQIAETQNEPNKEKK